ncbi:MAG: hypothetical protein AAFO01_23080 [Pseudomonadota bacterium]
MTRQWVHGNQACLDRSLFADDITVDFTSLVGGEPALIPADAFTTAGRTI